MKLTAKQEKAINAKIVGNYYKPIFFSVKELVPEHVYKLRGGSALKYMDCRILRAADILRVLFGPLWVNGDFKGKKFNWSGLRTSESGYDELSAHYRGCALDPKSKKYSGEQMRDSLMKYSFYCTTVKYPVDYELYVALRAEFFTLVTEIEKDTDTWIHIAVTNRENFKWIENPNRSGK